jgi:formylglycine-generating enzyme required for sulfatase activity
MRVEGQKIKKIPVTAGWWSERIEKKAYQSYWRKNDE